MRSLGWVEGGAETAVEALIDVLGPAGTLVMPAATPRCSDPAQWPEPAPASMVEELRESTPLFDRDSTPTTMGAIAECFRRWPGTLRSDHPLESVCARGPAAAEIVAEHPLHYSEGSGGPWATLHRGDAFVLLIGVGFNRCTALHYAESRSPKRRVMTVRVPVEQDGVRTWREVDNVADDNDTHFPAVGKRFAKTGKLRTAPVGDAECLFFRMRDLLDCAQKYFIHEL